MQLVPPNQIRHWETVENYNAPKVVGARCGHCSEQVVFALGSGSKDVRRHCVSLTASCPNCAKQTHFWSLHQNNGTFLELHAHPSAKQRAAREFGLLVPEPLKRSYVSTVRALDSNNYVATAVCARRTLEGIFKYALPPGQETLNLHRAIQRVQETRDLAKPLTTLSHAIRQGGNLGAHFDAEREPTAQLAEQMVELLEYLIEYLYTLPADIARLEESLSTTPPDNQGRLVDPQLSPTPDEV
jgi:hypothetical protein